MHHTRELALDNLRSMANGSACSVKSAQMYIQYVEAVFAQSGEKLLTAELEALATINLRVFERLHTDLTYIASVQMAGNSQHKAAFLNISPDSGTDHRAVFVTMNRSVEYQNFTPSYLDEDEAVERIVHQIKLTVLDALMSGCTVGLPAEIERSMLGQYLLKLFIHMISISRHTGTGSVILGTTLADAIQDDKRMSYIPFTDPGPLQRIGQYDMLAIYRSESIPANTAIITVATDSIALPRTPVAVVWPGVFDYDHSNVPELPYTYNISINDDNTRPSSSLIPNTCFMVDISI